jgi:hypothetical protein
MREFKPGSTKMGRNLGNSKLGFDEQCNLITFKHDFFPEIEIGYMRMTSKQ